MVETDLYPAIKHYLESQGYEVKAEITDCDVVARRGEEPPIVVELKLSLTLPLLIQAIDRQALSDDVYMAIPKPTKSAGGALWKRNRRGLLKLCRRLGLGLITIDLTKAFDRAVEVHCDPAPYTPRKNKRRTGRLLKEFAERVGDPNMGGSSKTQIVTAYRQDALRCLSFIAASAPASLKNIREKTMVERAGAILQKNHYGWFERVERGTYAITPKGAAAMTQFADTIAALKAKRP